MSEKLRTQVFKRDKYYCQKCGRLEALEIHHIVPRVDNGKDILDNLITLCLACHKEWHSLECRSKFPFYKWLAAPPLDLLLYGWDSIGKVDASGISLETWRHSIITIQELVTSFYESKKL